jgi:hypothetical protein
MGYTIWPDTKTGDILSLVNEERNRQEDLKRKGKFAYTCADPASDLFTNSDKLTVLVEEVGEAAHEINEGIGPGRRVDMAKLKKELIEVAAVAVAWAESINPRKPYTPPTVRDLPEDT